jgi:hypothetical protein
VIAVIAVIARDRKPPRPRKAAGLNSRRRVREGAAFPMAAMTAITAI